MAGKKLHAYLEKHGPDGFYDLYHAWMENFITAANGLGYIDLIVRVLKKHPDFQAGIPACAELDAYVDLSQQMRRSIWEFFWPMTDAQDTQRPWKERLKHWEPFDEQAWDSIFPQLSVILQGILPSLDEFPPIVLACSDGLVFRDITITQLLDILTKFFPRLYHLSIPAGVEYQLFIHPHLLHLKANCDMFHFSLHRMRESCGENAALLSELDSQSEQDDAFYQALSRFFWPGTIGSELEEDAVENHWHPYVESAWDAALAQVLETSRSFVQTARRRLQNMQEFPIIDLPETEEFQKSFLVANAELDHILHTLAILETW